VVATLLVVVSGTVLYRWWHNRVPYGPDALRATATLELLPPAATRQAQFFAVEGDSIVTQPGDQIARGSVTWRPPPTNADGKYVLVLLDKRSQRKPYSILGTSPGRHKVFNSNDEALDRAHQRYEWLRGAGSIRTANAWHVGGATLWLRPHAAGVRFVAHFRAPRSYDPKQFSFVTGPEEFFFANAPVAASDLLLALVFIGPESRLYWAQRLYG
jgi:hypothetical protein